MNVRRAIGAVIASVLAVVAARAAAAPAPDACDRIRSLTVTNVTITETQTVPAGGLTLVGRQSTADLPAMCRVAATLKPSSDSDIRIEVWLPNDAWNSKLQAVGNGAWSGSIPYGAMVDALRRGYATAGTDTGHTGNSASFALGHPEKLIDFAWRSEHEMTVAAKAIVQAFYGRAAKFAYWNGCSAGGRQAMKAAQMFPADFDGIVAGSPGLDWSARSAQAVRTASALSKPDAQLTPAARQLVHDAVLRACDAHDGLKDGLIADPSRCTFDPATLQCQADKSSGCLTSAQVASVRAIYTAAVNPANGREMPGLAPGSELGWTELGWTASARATGQDHYRFIVFRDPAWTIERFDPPADTFRLDEGESALPNASDTNLDPFFARGGKLIQYHGWSDPQISPFSSIAYHRRVFERFGADRVSQSYRLFLAPGMGHCSGGEGPNQFDALAALERWVERGTPPDSIEASHATNGRVDRTRPLCPYPSVATYKGSGSVDDAVNFTCAGAKRAPMADGR
jgi:feruloyl esterase